MSAFTIPTPKCIFEKMMNREQRRKLKNSANRGSYPPNQLAHLIALATKQQDDGQFNAAEYTYRKILAINPDLGEVHHNLGHVLEKQNKLDEAAACYERALTLIPSLAESHYSLGNILNYHGKAHEALKCYERAIAIKPTYAKAYNSMGDIFNHQGDYEKAASCYRDALTIRPDFAEAHYHLGNMLFFQGKADEAAISYGQALALNPNLEKVHHNLGNIFKQQGSLDKALSSYERALHIRPDFPEAHYSRTAIKTFHPGDSDLASIKALIGKTDNLPADKRKYVHFGLGKALEDVREYANAFEQRLKGNALKRQEIDYDEAATLQGFKRIAEIFHPDIFRRFYNAGDPSQTPIFIVGMPRSSTTLVEQILASHPLVYGAGELDYLKMAANGVFDTAGRQMLYPEYIPSMDAAICQKLGQAYLKNLPKIADGKTRITDKMPLNFRFVGLIHLILPNAKIIHTMRDPVDTCVSCFSTLFATSQYFTYDLAELGRYYRAYSELMDHWRSVLPPGVMLDFSYEELIDDFEPQVRQLLNYCGLPWDEHCLSFYKTKRTVTTASAAQVRQPLYRNSMKRWRNYEPYLGPLLNELGLTLSE